MWSGIYAFLLLLSCCHVLKVLFAGINWTSSQINTPSFSPLSDSQLPSCFLLFLHLHTPQPWDTVSSLFTWAALALNTSPLTLLSCALLHLGWSLAWAPWTCMKQQREASCTWWQFGICAASLGSQFVTKCILIPSDGGVSRWSHLLQRKPQELITLCQGYGECWVVIIHCKLCLACSLHDTDPSISHTRSAQHWGESWAQLKQTNELWR